ncbi:MAG TPA: SidA/IucD/PvdA family monooxygenase [Actinophytocola sp.]|uniref:lysine N(6)-hydroxylase/L-ornithine N(5)-oxygenase family protein n=1 Tax=Actinophytocola sp. TaxID=1872138 RepID=UPI002DDD0E5F|nr:SidA/IucD/PvdA family monooxygenase [Actinophytocola sp.]HEV2781553.1 SidA/IucD/PvdA family monooxygenase [Actinophytocola sp.]
MGTHRDVELLAIGAGPANLALAIAIEELAGDDLARDSLVIEQADTVSWQRGMLLPEAQSQVSFLKDLVTLRNPRSRFSFVNYLHSVGQLSEFINMGSFWPYRLEISKYFQWVANSLAKVRVEYRRRCGTVEPRRDANGAVTGWLTRLSDGSTIGSRYLVVGAGRDPFVPTEFATLPAHRVVHSSDYLPRISQYPKDVPYRVAVIGGAQSAAEMFDAVQRDLPGCRPTMIMRSIGLKTYENSRFTNELYFPSAVDDFFTARPEAREQILREMHITNYSGLAPEMLEKLYRQLYLDRLTGEHRLRIVTMTDVTAACDDGDEVVLELTDRRTGAVDELRCDLVLLGTGFVRQMPALVRSLANSLGLSRIDVTRNYRLRVDGPVTGACYLQGVNEATHGIADSLLSVLAVRASDIVEDILANRDTDGAEPMAAHLAPVHAS